MIGFQLIRLVLVFKCRLTLVSNRQDLAQSLLICHNLKYTKWDRTVFTGVCLSMGGCYASMPCSRGVLSQHALQVVSQHALQQGGAIPACIAGGIPACLTAGGSPLGGCLVLGGLVDTPLQAHTNWGKLRGIRSRSTPKGQIQGGSDPGPHPRGKFRGIRTRPPPRTTTAVGGTHPAGMHSCYIKCFL